MRYMHTSPPTGLTWGSQPLGLNNPLPGVQNNIANPHSIIALSPEHCPEHDCKVQIPPCNVCTLNSSNRYGDSDCCWSGHSATAGNAAGALRATCAHELISSVPHAHAPNTLTIAPLISCSIQSSQCERK